MFLSRQPSLQEIAAFLATSSYLPLSYEPIGLAEHKHAGLKMDQQETVIGRGESAFERGKVALATWRHFKLGWLNLFPVGAPIQPGTVVAVVIRHLGFWSINGCRVVYSVKGDPEREFGFAYGTLTNHAESGEELFKVSLCPQTGAVSYLIRAVSRPRAPLARLGYPVTRSLQARFRRDSSAAIVRAMEQPET